MAGTTSTKRKGKNVVVEVDNVKFKQEAAKKQSHKLVLAEMDKDLNKENSFSTVGHTGSKSTEFGSSVVKDPDDMDVGGDSKQAEPPKSPLR